MFTQIKSAIRNNFITGLLVIAPLGVVLWIVLWLWQLVQSIAFFLPDVLDPRHIFQIENSVLLTTVDILMTFLTLVGALAIICVVGLVSRNYLGKQALRAISHFLTRVPVLSTVYSTLEQLMKTFASGQSKNFRRVVYVEYPRKGMYTLALVTGERSGHPMHPKGATDLPETRFVNVFVPTTPNPTSGFYLSVPTSEVRETNMTVEQALKEIISMGIVQKDG